MSAKTYANRMAYISLLSIMLCSCYRPPFNEFRDPLPLRNTLNGAGVGAFTGTIMGNTALGIALGSAVGSATAIYNSNVLIRDLRKADIEFVQHGDTMMLIVPTDRYFIFNTPTLNDTCYKGLNYIIRLLKYYPCATIYVAGFTDNVGPRKNKSRMSQAQAEAMLTFLWANNISAVRLTSEGYGDKYSIADNKLIRGSALNRRIEIQWVMTPPEPLDVPLLRGVMK